MWKIAASVIAVLGSWAGAVGQPLSVTAVSPQANMVAAPETAAIVVDFDRALDPGSVTAANFWAFGRNRGRIDGTLGLSNGDTRVTLTPAAPMVAGDMVTVYLSRFLKGADQVALRPGGYSFQFWVRVKPAAMDWRLIQTLTTRTTPGSPTQAYGGVASDLDSDGWMDLTIVHEITADLRVFRNKADASGTFHPFFQPTFAVGSRASPSESADFNRDGSPDICVANITAGTVSVLLGLGDGRYAPQQSIPVGAAPRGIAVLDIDGDGDQDIACTNSGANNMCVMLNNGSGVLGAPAFFQGGGQDEWSLGAADMTGDGLLDLVVGSQTDNRIIVCENDGGGAFIPQQPLPVGGQTWVIQLGDLNGDRKVDAVSANSLTNNGAVLLGDGQGGFAAPVIYAADPFTLSTDLADLDGDGDLDWNLSSYGGDWRFYLNDGSGAFTFDREIPAPEAASCTVYLDFDNDRDTDLALIDEEADVVLLYANECYADCNRDGSLNLSDFGCFTTRFALGEPYADCNGDGVRNLSDFGCFTTKFALGCP